MPESAFARLQSEVAVRAYASWKRAAVGGNVHARQTDRPAPPLKETARPSLSSAGRGRVWYILPSCPSTTTLAAQPSPHPPCPAPLSPNARTRTRTHTHMQARIHTRKPARTHTRERTTHARRTMHDARRIPPHTTTTATAATTTPSPPPPSHTQARTHAHTQAHAHARCTTHDALHPTPPQPPPLPPPPHHHHRRHHRRRPPLGRPRQLVPRHPSKSVTLPRATRALSGRGSGLSVGFSSTLHRP